MGTLYRSRRTGSIGFGRKRTEAAIRAAVEAILFAAGGSVEASRLAAALELETGEMEDICGAWSCAMRRRTENPPAELEGAWQLCTKKEYYGD